MYFKSVKHVKMYVLSNFEALFSFPMFLLLVENGIGWAGSKVIAAKLDPIKSNLKKRFQKLLPHVLTCLSHFSKCIFKTHFFHLFSKCKFKKLFSHVFHMFVKM